MTAQEALRDEWIVKMDTHKTDLYQIHRVKFDAKKMFRKAVGVVRAVNKITLLGEDRSQSRTSSGSTMSRTLDRGVNVDTPTGDSGETVVGDAVVDKNVGGDVYKDAVYKDVVDDAVDKDVVGDAVDKDVVGDAIVGDSIVVDAIVDKDVVVDAIVDKDDVDDAVDKDDAAVIDDDHVLHIKVREELVKVEGEELSSVIHFQALKLDSEIKMSM